MKVAIFGAGAIGGMMGVTKFLNPLLIEVMWRAFLRTGTPQFSQVIFTTLDGILFGGAYDHVGGGFFRHSLDERWLEPAFEKMLYDQAQIAVNCLEARQATGGRPAAIAVHDDADMARQGPRPASGGRYGGHCVDLVMHIRSHFPAID